MQSNIRRTTLTAKKLFFLFNNGKFGTNKNKKLSRYKNTKSPTEE